MAGHYVPGEGWVEDDEGNMPAQQEQPQYDEAGGNPAPQQEQPMQGGGGDWGYALPSSMEQQRQTTPTDQAYAKAFPEENRPQDQWRGMDDAHEAVGLSDHVPTEAQPWDPKVLEERRSQPGWDDQTGGGRRSEARKPDLMYFTNPQTGRGGVVELPAGRDGEKLQWDYQQRGFQTSVNQRPGQDQQQDGGGNPAMNVANMLAKVQLTQAERNEMSKLQNAMGVINQSSLRPIDKERMIKGVQAQLAPLMRRDQQTQALMRDQAAQEKTRAHAQDFAAVAQRAKAWKEMFDKGDLSVDVKDKDGNTVAVMAMGPDGKTIHFPAAKPEDSAKKDDMAILRQQAQEKHVIDMEKKKKDLEAMDAPKEPKLADWQERARGDLAREGVVPPLIEVPIKKDGKDTGETKTSPNPVFEKLVHVRAGEYMANHRDMRAQQQKEREQKTQGFTQAPLPSNQQTAPQGPPQPQQGPPPQQAAPVPPPAPQQAQAMAAGLKALHEQIQDPAVSSAAKDLANLYSASGGNLSALPPEVQAKAREQLAKIRAYQAQQQR